MTIILKCCSYNFQKKKNPRNTINLWQCFLPWWRPLIAIEALGAGDSGGPSWTRASAADIGGASGTWASAGTSEAGDCFRGAEWGEGKVWWGPAVLGWVDQKRGFNPLDERPSPACRAGLNVQPHSTRLARCSGTCPGLPIIVVFHNVHVLSWQHGKWLLAGAPLLKRCLGQDLSIIVIH